MKEPIRIFRGLDELDGEFRPAALSIGNFDGVHAGHRRIFRRVVELARLHGWKPSAMTFAPHPTRIVAPERAPRLLTSPDQRCALMADEGIVQALILPFGDEIARLTPEQFAREILVERLGVRAVLIGANFRFGHGQAGDPQSLAELGGKLGFIAEVVPAFSVRGRMISSSAIRRLVAEGSVALAGRLLERPHFLDGDVVSGRGIGSRLTVPTLNILPAGEVLPAPGVYVTRTLEIPGSRIWPSVTNIGFRPTFGGGDLSIETYLMVPLAAETPRRIRIEFLMRLREERKFPDAPSLKAQILRDARRAEIYFRRISRWIHRSTVVPRG